ncbi:hypothetical protein N0V90_002884 [Kalmusia sp. IMI 367209]|nr:hypothetical protein N0V90_002884 [Kalmusia sp. IMI 367209]
MSVSIPSLAFEHHYPAFGIAESTPRISWRFEGTAVDWEQASYEVEITRGPNGVPRLFNVKSEDSILVPWPDEPLESAESASVRARAFGKDGQPATEWSAQSSVETGLLNDADWEGAIPIAANRDTELGAAKRPVLFRKEFNIDLDDIASARLYITALGLYVAELNGERVGDHVLAPGYMSYQYRHTYDTYDVTNLIKRGKNAVGATIGEGWWAGRFAFLKGRENYGDTLGLLGLLVVTAKNGSKQTVKTDLSWNAAADGPIITSNIYDGEAYDSRLEKKGWSTPDFNSSGWLDVKQLPSLKGNLTSPDGSPIRRIQEVKPKEVLTSKSGKTIIDFGQNLVGWVKLTNVQGPAGTNITLVHTEVLENGEIATRPLRTAKATDTFVLSSGDAQSWEPSFTYHGFRYVQVTGWPNGTSLDSTHLAAVVVHSDMERTGYFECSDELLNKFHSNVIWSMRGNFLSVPTDCPQRDERLGWTGDAHAFMPTSNYLYNTAGFWRSWLKDVWSDTSTGSLNIVPEYVPTDDVEFKEGSGTTFPRRPIAIWGDVIVGNPWALYQSTGDKQMLEEQYDGARTWIDSGIPRNDVGLWERSTFQYGDWLDPKAPADEPGAATTHKHLVADAYLLQMTRLLSDMSTVIGKPSEAAKYTADREALIREFTNAWIEPYDGLIANITQTALVLGIRFDIFDDATRARAASTLDSLIQNNSYLVGTGFAGTQQLGFALSSVNLTSTFYKMLFQTKVPSWLYQVVMGGTTTWERWDSMLADGSVNPGSMTSFNHYAFGSVADWIHQKIGGLAIAEPGWKSVRVAPEPGGGITNAKASFLSPYGTVSTSWAVTDAGFQLEVTVPPNSKAEVVLPGGNGTVQAIGSGFYTFQVDGYKLPD